MDMESERRLVAEETVLQYISLAEMRLKGDAVEYYCMVRGLYLWLHNIIAATFFKKCLVRKWDSSMSCMFL